MRISKVRIAECRIPLPKILRLGLVEIGTREYVLASEKYLTDHVGMTGEATYWL